MITIDATIRRALEVSGRDLILTLDPALQGLPDTAHGGSVLDPDVVRIMVGRQREDDPVDDLSPREREVLGLMAEGRSNQGIADVLVVTVAAIERHVTRIFAKLRLNPEPKDHRRVLAVLEYLHR